MALAGVGAGLVVSCLVFATVGYALAMDLSVKKRRGWNLKPVVVAAVDVPAGTAIDFEHVSQRSVPEQFVTREMVQPDSASYVVNRPAAVPLLAGDPLLWSSIVPAQPDWECASRVDRLLEARGDAAVLAPLAEAVRARADALDGSRR